jgi:hypothetical protein
MSRKVFTAGEVLAAADVNSFLMDQVVASFATSASRGSAIPSPVEGMVSFLEDSNILAIYDGSNWKTSLGATGGIIQVVSTTKTDPFSISGSTYEPITGLTATITPKSTSNKILVTASVVCSQDVGANNGFIQLVRGATAIGTGTAAGNRRAAGFAVNASAEGYPATGTLEFLDSPASTSELTYGVQISAHSGAGFMFVNRSDADTNDTFQARYSSTITVMEVSA